VSRALARHAQSATSHVAWLAVLSITAVLAACDSDSGVVGSYAGTSLGTMRASEPPSARPIEERAEATADVVRDGRGIVVSFTQNGRPVPCRFTATGGPTTWSFPAHQVCRQGRPDDGITITVADGTARFDDDALTIVVRSSVVFTGPEAPMRAGTHEMRFTGRRE